MSNTVDEIARPDAETAIVKGTYQLEGIKILGFNNWRDWILCIAANQTTRALAHLKSRSKSRKQGMNF